MEARPLGDDDDGDAARRHDHVGQASKDALFATHLPSPKLDMAGGIDWIDQATRCIVSHSRIEHVVGLPR